MVLPLSDRAVDLDTGRLDGGAELHRELLVAVWGYARKSRST